MPNQDLASLFVSGEPVIAPGIYDALSARIAQSIGFRAAYYGSYNAASSRGLPDVGLLTMDELLTGLRMVTNAVDIPVIADGENGFYSAANIWRMVRGYEQANAAAIHIDDHLSGKHSDLPRVTMPLAVLTQNLRAALDARRDARMLIIGRTDITWATGDAGHALERMQAMLEAGADLVCPVGVTLDDVAKMRMQLPGRVMVVHDAPHRVADEAQAGADLVVYHSMALRAATQGVTNALTALCQTGDAGQASNVMDTDVLESLLDYAGFNARGHRYDMR